MTTLHAHYNAVSLRHAIETLQRAVVDPEADGEAVSLAHQNIQQARLVAPPVVSQWIDTYLESLSNAEGGSDVTAAVQRIAEQFKLPLPERPLTVWEQGRLFE